MENFEKILTFDQIIQDAVYPLGSTTGKNVSLSAVNIDLDNPNISFVMCESPDRINWYYPTSLEFSPNPSGTNDIVDTANMLYVGITVADVTGAPTSGSCRINVTVKD